MPLTPGLGAAVVRKEDLRLLTGRGCFSDDVNLQGQVYAAMVRSPHAHARTGTIDNAEGGGGAVAVVVAESVHAARDAAERVIVDYEPLPAVTVAAAAARSDAPRIWGGRGSQLRLAADI